MLVVLERSGSSTSGAVRGVEDGRQLRPGRRRGRHAGTNSRGRVRDAESMPGIGGRVLVVIVEPWPEIGWRVTFGILGLSEELVDAREHIL